MKDRRDTRPAILTLYHAKESRAKSLLGNHFVSIVTFAGRTDIPAIVVWGASNNVATFTHANFALFAVFCRKVHAEDLNDLYMQMDENVRLRYLEQNFRAGHVIKALSSYCRNVLEDKDEPNAMEIEALTFDSKMTVGMSSFRGELSEFAINKKQPRVFISGAYQKGLRLKIYKILKKYLCRNWVKDKEKAVKQVNRNATLATREIKKLCKVRNAGFTLRKEG